MQLTDRGIKLLFPACFSHLTTPLHFVQATTKTHQLNAYATATRSNQIKLCDCRQKIYFHVHCQTVGMIWEAAYMLRLGCKLRLVDQIISTLADALCANVIYQTAFIDMTSARRWRVAGQHTSNCRSSWWKGFSRNIFLWEAVCFKAPCHQEYHSNSSKGKWNQDIFLWSRLTVVWYIISFFFLSLSLKKRHWSGGLKLLQDRREQERQVHKQPWIIWKEQQNGSFD